MAVAFLLNPGTKSKRRRARRIKGHARRSSAHRGHARRRYGSKRRSVNRPRGRHVRRTHRRNPRGWYHAKPKSGNFKVAYSHGKRKGNPGRRHKRGRNPGIGGLMALNVPTVVPFRIPLPGVLGRISNAIVQGAAAGGVVFLGYSVSGAIVNPVDAKMVKADGTKYLGKWQRPVLFAFTAALTGWFGATAAGFAKGNKVLWGALAGAGSGIRAFSGIVANLIPATSTGFLANVKQGAVALADYMQVDDYMQVEGGDPSNDLDGVGDPSNPLEGEDDDVQEQMS